MWFRISGMWLLPLWFKAELRINPRHLLSYLKVSHSFSTDSHFLRLYFLQLHIIHMLFIFPTQQPLKDSKRGSMKIWQSRWQRSTHTHTHTFPSRKVGQRWWKRKWVWTGVRDRDALVERSFPLKHLSKVSIKCHQCVDPAVKLIKYYSPGWTKTKTEISWRVLLGFFLKPFFPWFKKNHIFLFFFLQQFL